MPLAATAQSTPPDKQPGPPEVDYLVTPAGWVHKDCVVEIQEDEEVEATDDVVIVKSRGKETRRISKCSHRSYISIPRPDKKQKEPFAGQRDSEEEQFAPNDDDVGEQSQEPVPTIANSWLVSSWLSAPANSSGMKWFNKASGTWTVPKNPTSNGATVFIFNSLEPFSGQAIIQPVLQWGPSAAGGGNFWSYASWFLNGPTGVVSFSPLRTTTTGHAIKGTMTASNCTTSGSCNWTISTADTTASASSVLSTVATQGVVFDQAQPAVIEAWTLSSCGQLPASASRNPPTTTISNTFLFEPGPSVTSLNDVTLTNPWQTILWATGLTPQCSYAATLGSRSTILQY